MFKVLPQTILLIYDFGDCGNYLYRVRLSVIMTCVDFNVLRKMVVACGDKVIILRQKNRTKFYIKNRWISIHVSMAIDVTDMV